MNHSEFEEYCSRAKEFLDKVWDYQVKMAKDFDPKNELNNYFPQEKYVNFEDVCIFISEQKDITLLFPQNIREKIKESAEPPVVADLAGRDSLAAIIKSIKERQITIVLPVAHYIPVQYGSWTNYDLNVKFLKEKVESKYRGEILDYIVLGDLKFWYLLNGRYIQELITKFGFYSPCVGCHLFFHATCAMVASALGSNIVISGERESHDGYEKINQLAVSIEAYRQFLESLGVEHFQPLRFIKEGRKIEEILQTRDLREGQRQLHCIFSGNYKSVDEKPIYDTSAIETYFNTFAIPITKRIIDLRKQAKKDTDMERDINKFLKKSVFPRTKT